ncbi:PQQ-binding-like beta-propeller repeat protein, partial [Micromonospora azadirachtae]
PAAPKRRGRLALLLAGGLVAVLAIGAGTVWGVSRLIGGGDGLKTAWTLDYAEQEDIGVATFDQQAMFGAWLTEKEVVRAQAEGLLAYQLSDGARAWAAATPEGTSVCVAAQTVTDGRGAIAFGAKETCDVIAGFDLNSGKLTWQKKISAPKLYVAADGVTAPELSVAGQQVIVRSDNSVIAFSLTDGKQLWKTTPQKLVPKRDCGFLDGRAAGELVVIGTYCYQEGAKPDSRELAGLDPATGKVRWRQSMPGEAETDGFLSLQPLISQPGLGQSAYINRDPRTGKEISSFTNPIDGTKWMTLPVNQSNSIDATDIYSYLSDEETIYLPTFPEPVPGKGNSANQVVAVDLATGTRRWVSSGHTDSTVQLIRRDEQGLLAWEVGAARLAPRLVRIDPATGKVTVVVEGPLSAATEADNATVLERDGTVVIVPWKHVVADAAITVLR